MKKLFLSILVICSLLSFNANAEDIYLECSHESGGSIILSFNSQNNTGKEYIGGDSKILYVVEISEASLLFQAYNDNKFVRGWNIDRYSGDAYLNDSMTSNTVQWHCRPGSKMF